jgi:Flp pilus assembly protein TadG
MEAWGHFDVRGIRRLWTAAMACRRVLSGESGSALVELALVVAVLGVPLLLGTAQMGVLVYDSIEVSDAANEGALFGMQNSTDAADTTDITAAARKDAPDIGTNGANLGVSTNPYYVCALAVGGTQYTGTNAATTAAADCTGTGNHALEFVQVSTSVTITPFIHCPGLPASFPLSGQAAMEVEK